LITRDPSGFCGAIVNAAGDIASFGGLGPGQPFRIGIADPFSPRRLAEVVYLTGAIATSGTYKRGHHLVDPRTDRPVARAASASVTGPGLGLADALATAAATARTVAVELTARGALAAHLDAELHIDPADIPSPVQAASASALSFTSGAVLPMLAILLPPADLRVPVTFVAVLIALGLTGALSARLGGSDVRRAILRVVIGGALGLAFTYGIGHLFGTAIGLPGG